MPEPMMPGLPPIQGAQLPPGMMAAPPNLGGATRPSANPGNAASAMLKMRDAIKLMEDALPSIPMGSPLHVKTLSVIKSVLEALPDEDSGTAGPQMAGLLQLIRQQSQNAPNAALARLMPQAASQAPAMPQAGPPGM